MLIILVLIAGFCVWLSQTPGTVDIVVFGYHISIPFAVGILGLLILFFVLYLLASLKFKWKLFRVQRYFKKREKQTSRQETLLLEGFAAVAAKDITRVQKCLKKLDPTQTPLSLMLEAQAAMLRRDGMASDAAFQKMLANPQTQMIGLRGLALQYLARGELRAAKEVVQDTLRQHPSSPWAYETAFEIAVKSGDWEDALGYLNRLPEESGSRNHRKALIYFEKAQEIEEGNVERRVALFAKAYEAESTALPIVMAYAQALLEADQKRKATKVIEKAWQAHQHPELARLYMSIVTDPLERYQRMQQLHDILPQAWVGQLCVGEAALDAHLWGVARPYLEGVMTEQPIQRVYQAMIRLEDALGNVKAMRQWVSRSATEALPDPEWACQTCGYIAESWRSVCPNCHDFDTIIWTRLRHRDHPVKVPQIILPPEEQS